MVESPVQQSRSRDLDKLLLRPGNLVGPNFEPGPKLRDDLKEYVRVLVVGAGGLGCELLKDLALSGFREIEVIDMDTIEVHGVDDNISKSKKILTSMTRRMSRNKWIIGSIIAVLVIAIALILYFKLR